MELPADPSPTSGAELERLEKEQALGETANLGRPGVETTDAIKTVVSCGSAKIPGETATPGSGQTAAIPTKISRSGKAAAIPAAIPGGPAAALTAATAGGAETIQASKGETRTGRGREAG